MRQITDRLFIGNQEDAAQYGGREGWATVLAAKHPFHVQKVGKVSPDHPHYFSHQEGDVLRLNVVDPPIPLFQKEPFLAFLSFAREAWQRGLSLQIFCNQGRSRSASLALLFCAKVLGNIDSTTYDNAWDGFEALAGAKYEPGKGIETWLRLHWDKLPNDWIAHIDGAAPEDQPDRPLTEEEQRIRELQNLTPEEAEALVLMDPSLYFTTALRIKDKFENLTHEDGTNMPHVAQLKAVEAYLWCLQNEVPIRLILGPKARQVGFSTISAAICIHHSKRFRTSGMVIADQFKRTELLWKMFTELVDNDRIKELWGTRDTHNSEIAKFHYTDPDGTERNLEWLHDTAKDPKAGASGTRGILWFSECGRYGKEGKVTDLQVISNASSSVPEAPGTLIIMESTAEGANGVFYSRVKGAVTLEERMSGKVGNGWIKVFCAWQDVPDYRIPRTPQNEEWFSSVLDEEEKRGVMLYGWTAEQIAWRRSKLNGQFEGNLSLFKQEFPASEDEAFQSSGSPRFDLTGLTRIQNAAKLFHSHADLGVLEEQRDKAIMFVKTDEAPWLWVKERPMYGAKYLVFGDYMTGEQSKGSTTRDCHAVGVWRAAYKSPDGVIHQPKLVAAIHVPKGCRWDCDKIAERTYHLSKFFGSCTIAAETNQAMDIIHALIGLGANLWQRTKADEESGITGQTLKIPGWKTTTATRPLVVSEWAKYIREQEIEIEFEPMASELSTFVTFEDGSCAAKHGCHDDWVLAGGIGLVCLTSATEYKEPAAYLPTTLHAPRPLIDKGSGAIG